MDRLIPLPSAPAQVPKGLRGKARTFYLNVLRDFVLSDHHVSLLEQAAWSLQRSEEARARVDEEGLTYEDDKGKRYPNPCVVIEKENRVIFTRIVRELGLDLVETDSARPPTRQGRRTR